MQPNCLKTQPKSKNLENCHKYEKIVSLESFLEFNLVYKLIVLISEILNKTI